MAQLFKSQQIIVFNLTTKIKTLRLFRGKI